MEQEVLERVSVCQFIGTLTIEEIICMNARLVGYEQVEIAQILGDSPATICRIFKRIQSKYIQWNA